MMRVSFAVWSLPLLSLAACGGGGGGTNSLGSVAPPAAGSGSGGIGAVTPTPSPTATSLFDVTTTTSFAAIGAMQSFSVSDTGSSLYQGNASTVATPSGSITYNPRDGIFTMALADTRANISRSVNFQDPGHRTDFNPSRMPEFEVPNYADFNYLEALDGAAPTTFFYQRPGTKTSYVTLGGFVHSEGTADPGTPYSTEHGVFVFGNRTSGLQVPVKGAGHFEGDFIATMIGNSAVFQWMRGTSSVDVDFAKSTLSLALAGTVGPAFFRDVAVNATAIDTGATFNAAGSATIDSLRSGFSGKFDSASFTEGTVKTAVDFAAVSTGSSTAGASSIDGAFFGPNAAEVGGNFRITGGVPDQRLDIHGAFTGAKK